MSIEHINLDWGWYWCLVFFLSIWNCGWTAITQPGLLLYPIRKFFERKKEVEEVCSEEGNMKITKQMSEELKSCPVAFHEDQVEKIMEREAIRSVYSAKGILKLINEKKYPSFLTKTEGYILPAILRKPFITCITCMPSVHGFLIYTTAVWIKGWQWNPIEWLAVAIPACFIGTFLWDLKAVIDKHG